MQKKICIDRTYGYINMLKDNNIIIVIRDEDKNYYVGKYKTDCTLIN